jgi:hypothetical protein
MRLVEYCNLIDFSRIFDQFFLHAHPCSLYLSTEKNFRRIINPQKGFMSAKSVYQRALPFDKPFFLKKVDKGLSLVAN